MASFEEILNKPASEIETPKPYPVGSYHCIVSGPPEHIKSSQKGTDGMRFRYKVMRPMEDVDQQAAVESQVVGKEIVDDVWVTENSAWRLKDLLVDTLGVSEANGKTVREMLSEAPGKQLIVKIKHQLSDDGKRVFSRVESTARV